jgi:hypothetical protein
MNSSTPSSSIAFEQIGPCNQYIYVSIEVPSVPAVKIYCFRKISEVSFPGPGHTSDSHAAVI